MTTSFIMRSLDRANLGNSQSVELSQAAKEAFVEQKKNVFAAMGLKETDIQEFYKNLELQTFKGNNLFFGEALNKLNDSVYTRTADNPATKYVEKRTKVLEELIRVFEEARNKQDPQILRNFLTMTVEAAEAAGKDQSVHSEEAYKAAQHAVSGNSSLEKALRSSSQSFIYDPMIFDKTLNELKIRHQHLAAINATEIGNNFEKHGIAGGIKDFGVFGLIQTAVLSKNTNVLNWSGEAIKASAKAEWSLLNPFSWFPRAPVEGIKQGSALLTKPWNWFVQLKNMFNFSKATAGGAELVGGATRAGGFLMKLGARLPGWGKLATIAGGLLVAGSAAYCYASDNPKWSEPIKNVWNSLTEGYQSWPQAVAAWVIPDFGKIVGRSWFETNRVDYLKKGLATV